MAPDVERVDRARQQSNDVYKAGQLQTGRLPLCPERNTWPLIGVHSHCGLRGSSVSSPYGCSDSLQLPAAYFETRLYGNCIEHGTKALTLLGVKADENPDGQNFSSARPRPSSIPVKPCRYEIILGQPVSRQEKRDAIGCLEPYGNCK